MTFSSLFLIFVSMYYLVVGITILLKNRCNRINVLFFLFTTFVGLWTFIFAVTYSGLLPDSYTLFLTRAITIPAFFYAWLFLLLAKTFPENTYQPSKFFVFINGAFTVFFLLNLFSSQYISSAHMESGKLFFEFGFIYVVFGIYCSVVMLHGSKLLFDKYRHSYGQNRQQLLFVGIGAICSILFAVIFSVILPFFGLNQYNFFSPASAIFLITFWFLSILKYRLMDVTIVIKKSVSYVVLFFLVITSLVLTHFISEKYLPQLSSAWISGVLTLLWAFLGQKTVREGLITTTKRTFIKGYYNPETLFSALSSQIKDQTNRSELFNTLKKTLDDGLQFEKIWTIVAVRDDLGKRTMYHLSDDAGKILSEIPPSSPLIEFFSTYTETKLFKNFSPADQQNLLHLGFDKKSIFIPLLSPEMLEGVLILGERSGGVSVHEKDLNFIQILVNHVSATLYRLMPYEKLEEIAKAQIELQGVLKTIVTLSHEINSPLTSLSIGLGVLEAANDSQHKLSPVVKNMKLALEKISETIKNLSKLKKVQESDYFSTVKMISVPKSEDLL